MKMRIKILPYKGVSLSALSLARAMPNARKIRLGTPNKPIYTYVPRKHHIVINWGNTTPLAGEIEERVRWMLNPPKAIRIAVNKRSFFEFCAKNDVCVPEFTLEKKVVLEWIKKDSLVIARLSLNGRAGQGIRMIRTEEEILDALLYTRYRPKKAEFRVHVLGDKVIDVQQKRKKADVSNEDVDYKVRSYNRGWVFCRGNISPPKAVSACAVDAVKKLGLDFGAVDIGWTENKEIATCYEINTAPGLEGTTLENYSNNLQEYIKNEINRV